MIIFINLVDNFNENGEWFAGESRFGVVNDQVSGYTLANIEANILPHSFGLSGLKTHLKSFKPSGVTNTQIDVFLNQY